MTITQLTYVLAVAEYKNFTKASEKVFVTQPTLSMQVQKLEEELNVKIFDRSKKPIKLTPVGEKIIEQAKNIVNESVRIQDIVDQQKGFVGGEFKLGIISTVMPTLLPMFLRNFVNKYPKINLKIEELHTEAIIEKLIDGHLDAGIAATPLGNEKIKEKPLYYEPFMAYIPEQHRLFTTKDITAEDLDVDEVLLLEDGHCFKDNILNLCKSVQNLPDQRRFYLESGSFETLIKLSDEGLGMTLLPYLHTLDLKEGMLKNVKFFKKPYPSREISLVHHKNELKSHIINALQESINSIVKAAIQFQDIEIISPLNQNRKV
ncbi:hydrogen peroxide-inducible genes activator [Psychroflexus sediminis]|uniref:LysR family transcriptional regulator, hydrogen peroxide-inducible genes activator n=1 Tax=Psychroflexus sediminis TaxID=470826 RepID=A0A1G7V4K4_9FLAO|nr:hydrogen peroxide-inducible genes activator [Psychroflexus sediminis]SDG54498.1 LysR family transcriptional regulator, hydrogen peroxide-inducible genes activator [Psychroflexus sediminis]